MPSPPLEPGLYVVATPIGNLRDVTLRALDVLGAASRVYAEDTRITRKLLDAYGLTPRLSAYHDYSDETVRDEVLAAIARSEAVALVSDAGTPLISDPGFKLVRAALEAGHKVIPIPGASAALAALVAAGLPTDRFFFAGFPPSKGGARKAWLEDIADIRATLVLYETGPRLSESLSDMAAVLGNRQAAVARELTKLFEEVKRGDLMSLAAFYESAPPKGEIVVLIERAPEAAPASEDEVNAMLRGALQRVSVKEAAGEAAQRFGIPRKKAYARALAIRDEP
ncbi:MAG: 16S rRNA (cytidine(1402)-2'-O)-methyltransferase [Caulobacterales bacterium]